ncbi:O-antigen ligase family protein [Paenisporosarcina sp. NPDC076907]|uniref:O-antigen ligase family protein n=1 Tax=Paenisporosarcina sp. NPDC076907 TaxID=3390604 RepID=UPI003D03902F
MNFSVTTYKFFVFYLIVSLFAPPIPIGIGNSDSFISFGIFVITLFIVWRTLKLKFEFLTPFKPYGFFVSSLVFFIIIHSLYFLLLVHNINVFLYEIQWIVYFLGLALLIFDIFQNQELQNKLLKSTIFLHFLLGITGIISSFTGPFYSYAVGWYDGRYGFNVFRAIGTSGSANGLAGSMAIFLIITILSPKEWLPFKKTYLIFVFGLTLILTQSKSGFLAFLLGFGVLVFIQFLFNVSLKKLYNLYFLMGLFVGLIFLLKNFISIAINDSSNRVNYTKHVLLQYEESNFLNKLFGLGFRQTAYINSETLGWVTAHNSYVSLLAEIGLIGFGLIIGIIITSIFVLLKKKLWSILGGLLVYLFHLYSEGFLYGSTYIFYLMLFFSTALYYNKNTQKVTVELNP